MRLHLLVVGLLAGRLTGCGCSCINKNVQACNDWLAASECGDFDFSTVLDCNVYDNEAFDKCDMPAYFECVADHTTCDEALQVATVDAAACVPECK